MGFSVASSRYKKTVCSPVLIVVPSKVFQETSEILPYYLRTSRTSASSMFPPTKNLTEYRAKFS